YECWKRSSRERPTSTTDDSNIYILLSFYDKWSKIILTMFFSTPLNISVIFHSNF
ncbi:hypothetical protein PGIGA_G00040480, partial [Pangasianodon gigas]|nr:hypothetical protein [Pangasianodon gigas]